MTTEKGMTELQTLAMMTTQIWLDSDRDSDYTFKEAAEVALSIWKATQQAANQKSTPRPTPRPTPPPVDKGIHKGKSSR